jgi:hypothetical protein
MLPLYACYFLSRRHRLLLSKKSAHFNYPSVASLIGCLAHPNGA